MKNIKFAALLAVYLISGAAQATPFDDCMSAAQNVMDWSKSSQIQTCKMARGGFSDCYTVAQNVIDWSDASQVQNCVMAGAGFSDCFQAAQGEIDSDTGNQILQCVGGN